MNERRFYVYEHWRTDLDCCFYVGKGQKKRAWKCMRDDRGIEYWQALNSIGRDNIYVKIVESGLTEKRALFIEKDRIAHWRSIGVSITNMTDGGYGASGHIPSEEHRRKLSAVLKGKPKSLEHSAKVSASMKGNKNSLGIKRSTEYRNAVRARQTGRKHSPQSKEKMRIARIGFVFSADHRKKMSDAHRARCADPEERARTTERLRPYMHLPPSKRSAMRGA
jgi:hypothetical protein